MNKLIKEINKNPELRKIAEQMQSLPISGSPKERLHTKLRQCRMKRGGLSQLEKMVKDKQEEGNKEKKEKDEKNGEDMKPKIDELGQMMVKEVQQQKRKKRDKLAQLGKKMGNITFEQYSESLTLVNQQPQPATDVLNHHHNIINLYLKQHPCQEEVVLSDLSDSSDDEL
jgi:hypothetical protein